MFGLESWACAPIILNPIKTHKKVNPDIRYKEENNEMSDFKSNIEKNQNYILFVFFFYYNYFNFNPEIN